MNKLTTKKLLIISSGLLLVNPLLTMVFFNVDDSTYEHLNGEKIAPHSSELIRTVIFGQLVSLPIFSMLIGLIVAIFIDKELPYSKRIVRGFLLTLTTIYGIYALMGLAKLVTFLLR